MVRGGKMSPTPPARRRSTGILFFFVVEIAAANRLITAANINVGASVRNIRASEQRNRI